MRSDIMDIQKMINDMNAETFNERSKDERYHTLGSFVDILQQYNKEETIYSEIEFVILRNDVDNENDEMKHHCHEFRKTDNILKPVTIFSYRGYYSDMAIGCELSTNSQMDVHDLLIRLKGSIGTLYVGYKGGEFEMNKSTPLWISDSDQSHIGSLRILTTNPIENDEYPHKLTFFVEVLDQEL